MIKCINDDGFINRQGGKQHHISCGDDHNKDFTNIFWLYVKSFLITGPEVSVLGIGMWGQGVDFGFHVHRLNLT